MQVDPVSRAMQVSNEQDCGSDLVAFLRARLDEDEAAAKTGSDPGWRSDGPYLGWVAGGIAAQFKWTTDAAHAARHDPARVLREVAAKRAILDEAESELADDLAAVMPRDRLRHLAAVYSDHADYRPEWKP